MLRAEAAGLLQLLLDVRQRFGHYVHLLIFVDCLVVLDILKKWGHNDFHPGPKEVIHFTVVRPLIAELRQWAGNITLLKVKCHTGCLLNERADELAELGSTAEGPEICPGPQKYGSFWLHVRPENRRQGSQKSVESRCPGIVPLTTAFWRRWLHPTLCMLSGSVVKFL